MLERSDIFDCEPSVSMCNCGLFVAGQLPNLALQWFSGCSCVSESDINLARLSPSSSVSAPAADGAGSTWKSLSGNSGQITRTLYVVQSRLPNTKPISCILDSNFWSRHDGEIKQNRQGLENATLNIIIVESKVTWTGLPGAPLISKKRKCVSTSLMWRDAS